MPLGEPGQLGWFFLLRPGGYGRKYGPDQQQTTPLEPLGVVLPAFLSLLAYLFPAAVLFK
jgi:hypothetical protein